MTVVLLVDDDEVLLETLAEGLTAAGLTVLPVSKGSECLRTLELQPVDIVVSDIMMPDMDGIELIGQVRQRNQVLPIIAITGGYSDAPGVGRDDSGTYLRTAKILGATSTLSKPITPAKLLAEIRRCTTYPQP